MTSSRRNIWARQRSSFQTTKGARRPSWERRCSTAGRVGHALLKKCLPGRGARFNETRVTFSLEVNARGRRVTDGSTYCHLQHDEPVGCEYHENAEGARRWRLIRRLPLCLVTDAVLTVESKSARERLSIDVIESLRDRVVHCHLTKWPKRR